jgi:hypothetical protein
LRILIIFSRYDLPYSGDPNGGTIEEIKHNPGSPAPADLSSPATVDQVLRINRGQPDDSSEAPERLAALMGEIVAKEPEILSPSGTEDSPGTVLIG